MKNALSRQRRRLWRLWRTAERLVRRMQRAEPMCTGSMYLLRRRCGKSPCRCQQGELHATWVVTRSEKGHVRLYCVRGEERAEVRRLTGAYRDWQRARAALVKLLAELLRQLDALADMRLKAWPAGTEETHGPSDHRAPSPASTRRTAARGVRRAGDRR